MTNTGGKILVAGAWVQAIPANGTRTLATIQNTALGMPGYDPNGINSGPPLLVWPFGGTPNTGAANGGPVGLQDGALILVKPGDEATIPGAASLGAIWVLCAKAGATFYASDY